MNKGIIICGLNGSGKSTLGKELANKLNYKLIDVEDYYFDKNSTDYVYDRSRTKNEVIELILRDIEKYKNFVMTAVIGNYGEDITSKYTHAIVLDVPKDIRIQRVKQRSFDKFGERINIGGDLYEKENEFFEMVANKSEDIVENWIKTLKCNIIRLDGTKSIQENVNYISNMNG